MVEKYCRVSERERPGRKGARTHFLVVVSTLLITSIQFEHATGFSPRSPRNTWKREARVSLEATRVKDADPKDSSKNVVRIYKDYASRLWNETNPVAREKIANDKAAAAVRQVEHIMIGEEYVSFSEKSEDARQQLLSACQNMLKVMDETEEESTETIALTNETVAVVETSTTTEEKKAKGKKPRRSILFGAAMGAIVACWVFSGNYIFTGLFTLMTILGQLEYYRMVMNTGIYPARRISIVGACSMFITASPLDLVLLSTCSPLLILYHHSFLLSAGTVCTESASNMPPNVWNLDNDLVFNDAPRSVDNL